MLYFVLPEAIIGGLEVMNNQYVSYDRVEQSVLATNKVLRNTYLLLGMTLMFSGVMAGVAMFTGAAPLNPLITIAVYMGLIMLVSATANSALGIVSVFAVTGFMGYTLGPIISHYTSHFVNGNQIVMTSLAGTGLIFFAISGYVLTTKKDMSYLGGFLMAGFVIAFIASLVTLFFPMPILSLGISAVFMLLAAGAIMYETSEIIHGGQQNYVLATVTLYVQLYNMFLSLLHILAAFSGQSRE